MSTKNKKIKTDENKKKYIESICSCVLVQGRLQTKIAPNNILRPKRVAEAQKQRDL